MTGRQTNLYNSGFEIKLSGYNYEHNYSYINVPILIKYQHKSGLYVETSPQIGFLLDAKLKEVGQTIDFRAGTSSADFSWSFGIGYKILVVNL